MGEVIKIDRKLIRNEIRTQHSDDRLGPVLVHLMLQSPPFVDDLFWGFYSSV